MSDIWTFSPSSEVLLKRCLEAAQPEDENKEWVKKFKKIPEFLNKVEEISINLGKEDIIEVLDGTPEQVEAGKVEVFNSESEEPEEKKDFIKKLVESIQADPIERFPYVIQPLNDTPELFMEFGKNLSSNAIEKFCNIILSQKDLDSSFIENFFQYFFPAFLKRDYTLIVLDLLVKVYEIYPLEFRKHILTTMLKNTEISNKILQDFVETLKDDEKNIFLNKTLEVHLSSEEFRRNLLTVYTLYKDCKKNCQIQNSMEKLLIENSEHCSNEKNFGRLMLVFLQEQKNIGRLNATEKVEQAIEIHKTPFKKPCVNAIKEVKEKFK